MSTPRTNDLLWAPSPERARATAMRSYRLAAREAAGRELPHYDALHAWSVEDLRSFWAHYATWAQLPWRAPPAEILDRDAMPGNTWFAGGRLNYAEALLHPRHDGRELVGGDAPALIAATEGGARRTVTYRELRHLVARIRAALEREGVAEGDRVVAYACNVPETTALLLACASIGAVFSSCSPDFGAEAACARFAQVEPLMLFASPGYRYGGRWFDTRETLARLRTDLPTVRRLVLLPYPDEPTQEMADAVAFEDWLAADAKPQYAALPFDHPLYVLFSSGTTGLPKAMVHRAGGALLKHHNEHRLHCDVRPGDVVFYFTTCGWMMWNWLVSGLAQGATAVLYEGNPAHPDLGALWRLGEELGITLFGTSARYLHALDAHDARPGAWHDLGSLRTLTSTGSPLSPAGFRYVYDHVKGDLHLASIAGGTDIVGCFMLGVPTLPVYAGHIQRPALGVDLAAFDAQGADVRGEPGELICRKPLPSMPLRFWNDPEGVRYREAYFARYPGVWRHGDLIEVAPEGGIVVYGRSDATLNPGGVRIGTAEIYRPLERIDAVVEAAAVGRKEGDDETIWLFVVLRQGAVLDKELEDRIRREIRAAASPRHVPAQVLAVPQIPRTRSGKPMEIAVAHLVNGREVPNRAVVANPEALDRIAEVVARHGSAG